METEEDKIPIRQKCDLEKISRKIEKLAKHHI
jgi:hypothetical protein